MSPATKRSGAAARTLLVAALLLPLVARAETRPRYGGNVVASLTSAPASIDPLAAQSWAEVVLATLVFDGLYRIDANGAPRPHLASGDPQLSSDKKTARIPVRAGARFHDGRMITAADVVASLKRAQGAAQGEWLLAPVAKIKKDGDVVVLTLRRPVPELTTLLAAPQLAITPGGKAPSTRAPVGSGPFAVKKIASDARRIELAAFAEHFAGRPYADALTLRWFADADEEAVSYEAGAADVSLRGAVAFAGHQPKYPTASVDGPATTLVYLGFGDAHPAILDDADFRRAVSLAVNRGGLKLVGSGERVVPATLPEAPDLGGATPSSSEQSARVDAAAVALDKARRRHATLDKAKLTLIVDETRPDDVEVATRIVGALDRIGLEAHYERLAPREHARRVAAGQCDLYIGQLVAPTADPVHEYAAAFAAGGDRWPVTELQAGELVLSEAQTVFAERLPVVPLYHRAVRAHHKKTLRGLAFDFLGRLGYADAFSFPPPGATAEPK